MKVALLSFAHMHMGSYAANVNAHPDVEVVGIFNEDQEKGRQLAGAYKTDFYGSLDDILAKDSDAVIVCSANSDHKDMVVKAAEAGKHILCEKPISSNIEDAKAMIDVCDEKNVKLMIAFPCRFIPAVQRGYQIIQQGRLGKILGVRGTNHGSMPGGWFIEKEKSGGGAVIDHTVHVADLIRWMLGAEYTDVYAEVDTLYYPDLGIDDAGQLAMGLDNGAFSTLDTSWSRRPPFPFWGDVTLEFVGEKGVLEIDGFAQKYDLYSAVKGRASWNYWGSDMDKALVDSFVDMVVNDKPSPITGEDGLRALEVAIGAYKSAEEGKTVQLPLSS